MHSALSPRRNLLLAFLATITCSVAAQPKITSFSPAAGPAGTIVTITGTGFDAANNQVFFGAVKAILISGNGTMLTAVVPAGATYEPFSVLSTVTGLSGSSPAPFAVTYTNPFGTGLPDNFFLPGVNFATDYAPNLVAISDIDGDGKPDLVVGGFTGVFILRNVSATGTINAASFAPRVVVPGGSIPSSLVIKDMDGDGKPDIIVASVFYNTVTVLRNASTPGNIAAASFAGGFSFSTVNPFDNFLSFAIAAGDADGDGRPDLVISNPGFNSVSVLRNLSAPGSLTPSSFAPKVDFATDSYPSTIALYDIDGDGRPELVTANQTAKVMGPGTLSVLRNTSSPGTIGAGSFASHIDFAAGNNPVSLFQSDLDGDGKADLIAGNSGSGTTSILRNTSVAGSITASSLSPKVELSIPGPKAVGDVDGDGRPDIVTTNLDTISVYRNTAIAGSIGASSFAPRAAFYSPFAGTAVALGDLDGDGIPEVTVTNNSNFSVSVKKVNAPSLTAIPRIASFTPAAGPVGSTVTISGSGFNENIAGNTVFFGAVKASITAASSTSLTVTVPAGATYQPLSVLSGGTGYSAMPFITTFSNPYGTAIPYNFYKPKVDFSTGTLPYSVAIGDLDGDGKPDMVLANASANTISILRNVSASSLGVSSFASRIDIPVGNDPRAVAIGDLDGSGKPEIVVANSGSATVTVLRNSSSPGNLSAASFDLREDFATGSHPFSVAISDIDLDGKPDLITANLSAGTVSVLHNTGVNGTIYPTSFSTRTDYPAGTSPRFAAVSDLDGDGKADIAVVNEKSGTVSVLRNTAIINSIDLNSFTAPQSFATGSNPGWVGVSDIDADGKPDLVVVNYGSNNVSVLRNTQSLGGGISSGSFAAKVDFSTGQQPFSAAIGDVDGDGKPDVAVVNSGSTNLSVLRNTSTRGSINASSFAPRSDFAAGNYPISIAIGDLDGNGIPELVSADATSNNVSVLAINPPQPVAITSFSPASGPVGSTVTITGKGFDPTYSLNQVFFGAVKAQVTGGNATTLQVTVPAGATYYPISVSVNTTELAAYSPLPFVTTFKNPSGTGIPFNFYRPKVDIPLSGPLVYGVAFGDINLDGKPDMITIDQQSGTLSILRNNSSTGSITPASFAPPLNLATAPDPRAVAFADLDGYFYPDLVVLSPSSNTISVFRNTYNYGNIDVNGFYPRVDFPTGGYASSFAVGDLDGDGRPELVLTNPYAGTVTVLRNTSSHPGIPIVAFAAGVSYPAGNFPRSAAIADVNGDGKPDIIVANEKGNTVSVLLNNAISGNIDAGSFGSRTDYPVGINPPSVAVGDIDGDGRPDILVANFASSTVSVLRNTTPPGMTNTASFAPKIDFATGTNPFQVALGDADGDGKIDLVTANSNSNTISVLRNTSANGSITAASFTGKVDFGSGIYPLSLAFGDLDGDGIAEVAAANAGSSTISVFKVNNPLPVTATTVPAASSIATMESTTLQLYPNPTQGEFMLQLQGVKASVTGVELLNASGKTLEARTVNLEGKAASVTLRLSLRSQPAGVYYVKVTGVNGVQVLKVVVQR